MKQRVVVLDFGGQYTHLIARRCREIGVYSEILPYSSFLSDVPNDEYATLGIIISGGPRSVCEPDSPKIPIKVLLSLGLPILAICYGHQLIAYEMGGKLSYKSFQEYGKTKVYIVKENVIFKGLPKSFNVWMSHADAVLEPPPGFEVLARTDRGVVAAMANEEKRVYGVQFHPEVKHTEMGKEILKNFLINVCGFKCDWKPMDRVREILNEIDRTVPRDEAVICAVSGGVDSVTTATLLSKILGDRLYCVFVNHGLMRKGEPEEVIKALKDLGISNLIYVDASDRFLLKLKGVKDPEEKRRIIGEEFAKIFEEIALSIPNVKWLAQGTIYPDRVESGMVGTRTSLIKTHHNVAGLPATLSLKLLEPLKDLYKDEVRELAKEIGVPESIILRHPFPGPGLAVRIIGEVNEEKLRICRDANAILEEELKRAGIYDKVWQAFVVVTDSIWTGIKGDRRSEGYLAIVRIVESEDGMTADWYKIDMDLLDRISNRLTNEIDGITMVAYAVTSKPPSTIEAC